jgi:hypothetical protein
MGIYTRAGGGIDGGCFRARRWQASMGLAGRDLRRRLVDR